MSDQTCRWAGSDRPRIVPGRHDGACQDKACGGCAACERTHCPVCQIAHSAGACPECMAETREALRDIARMCNALPEEVEHRGVEGEAMFLLGPAADPEARGHLEASVAAGRVSAEYLADAVGETHPLWVLGTWDMLVRDALEHDSDGRPLTVASAVEYLDRQLTYLGGYEYLPFEDLSRDLRRCRVHLERVLHDGEQVDRGAPCMTCHRPVERATQQDGRVVYTCRRCRQEVSEAGYMMAVKAEYLSRADRLTSDDMAIKTGVPAGTIRRWANVRRIDGEEHLPLFYACGQNGQGRKVYRVADVERVRDTGGDPRRSATVPPGPDTVSNEGAA